MENDVFAAASAAVHSSTRIMLAALKFFLGQDEEAAADSDDEDEEAPKLVQPSKADVYKATKKVFLEPGVNHCVLWYKI